MLQKRLKSLFAAIRFWLIASSVLLFSLHVQALVVTSQTCPGLLLGNVESQAENVVVRPFAQLKKLKFLSYNVENFYESVGRYERTSAVDFRPLPEVAGRQHHEKTESKTKWLGRIVHEQDPDFFTAIEVESLSSAERFNREELGSAYRLFYFRGNDARGDDARGIGIAFFIKKDLPFRVDFRSHQHRTMFDPVDKRTVPVFSRDLAMVTVKHIDTSEPYLILLGHHAKSKRDRPGDKMSVRLRTAQYNEIAKIVTELKSEFGEKLPIILNGDFNTDTRSSAEVQVLLAQMTSAFDVASDATPLIDRVTHSYHQFESETVYAQLDDFFVTSNLFNRVLKAQVLVYKNRDGTVMPKPKTFEERRKQPSDHRAVALEIAI